MRITLHIACSFLALALICALSEALFYGGLGAHGVVQESLFLPLTFLFGFLGIFVLIGAALAATIKYIKERWV